jgi:hypothetical protein
VGNITFMQNRAAAIAIFAVALPLSAHCATRHHHHKAHKSVPAHHVSQPVVNSTPRLLPVAADVSGHLFSMPRPIRHPHLRAVRPGSLRRASIHARALYTRTTGTVPFALESWSAPYFVAYPALGFAQPPVFSPTPTDAQPVADAIPADSSSHSTPAFEAAPASSPFDAPADSPSDDPGVAAVTIVFKDGRRSVRIRNYILTRKALFIGDDNQPAIPVEQLDLTATIKANEEDGIAFQVPPSVQ